jgi:hypothetical protein
LAGPDGTFGSRFDDPEATYRVLYASSRRLGCYLETLARFRPDLSLFAELAQIEGEDDFPQLGQVPPEWAETRVVGSAFHYGSHADVYSSDWIGILRKEFAGFCIELGISELDAGALQQPTSRPLTQRVSRVVFNNGFDGIHYRSRFGHDVRNWALFEPFKIDPQQATPIDPVDADLQAALAIHGLLLVPR